LIVAKFALTAGKRSARLWQFLRWRLPQAYSLLNKRVPMIQGTARVELGIGKQIMSRRSIA